MRNEKWRKVVVQLDVDESVTLHYIAKHSIDINDEVICQTSRGDVTGKVIEIITYDAKHTDTHKNIRLLTKQEREELKMEKEMVLLLKDTFVVVRVKHAASGRENYLFTSLDLNMGDLVVYNSNNNKFAPEERSSYMHVGAITEIYQPGTCPNKINPQDFVVCKVDTTPLERDQKYVDKIVDIKQRLDAKKRAFERMSIYQMMAESDPEVKELLQQLNLVTQLTPAVPFKI